MSVEPFIISGIVEKGDPRLAYQNDISNKSFDLYQEEFEWIEDRYQNRKPINRRLFCERFQDFEYVVSKESLEDLMAEFKAEQAYNTIYTLIDSVSESLLPENALAQAETMRDVLGDVLKAYSPHSDIFLKAANSGHLDQVKQHRILSQSGQTFGMPTMIPSLDYHFDGLCQGRLISVLGRPGMGKSMLIAWLAWVAIKLDWRIGIFSPEMNKFEHTCRLHTLASADPVVQKEVGLKRSFRNRDLMRGTNFNIKEYKRFMEYFETLPGESVLFTKTYRRSALTSQYIGNRIEDLGLQGALVDPYSKLVIPKRRFEDNPVWRTYEIVGKLQDLAEEYNVFVVATNWSGRQYKKSEKAPDLDESFGSDALAQESDHVIGVRHDAEDHTLTLRCSKSRFGKPKFNAVIEFSPNEGRWHEIELDLDVLGHRLSQNGLMLPNGNEKLRPVAAGKEKVHA